MNLPLSAKEVPYILFYIIIPISFFSSVERFVNKVNDWLIKTNSFPIGEFIIFILTNDWPWNNWMLITVNKELRHHLSNSMVKRISHENLNPSHLHDDRHLCRNKIHGELLSGVQLFARNLFESITNKPMAPQKIQKILRQTKKPPSRYQSQPRNKEKKPNIYPEQSYRVIVIVLAIKTHSK